MAESGLGGRFGSKQQMPGRTPEMLPTRNALGCHRTKPCMVKRKMFRISGAFGCRAWVYLDKQRRQKGKHTPRATEAIYVEFTDNMSAWTVYIPEDRKIMSTNQVKFSEHEFPFRNRKMIDQFLSDNSTDILCQHASNVNWEPYNKLHVANYKRVHYDTKSGMVVLKIRTHSPVQFKANGTATSSY